MTQHKYQMSQAYYYTPKHGLRVSGINSDHLEVITPNIIRSHGQLRQILQNLFNVFSNGGNNKHDNSGDEGTNVKQHSDSNDVENNAMQDLENCANAARETGACGQYKWVKKNR
jgi:hypothetical protein